MISASARPPCMPGFAAQMTAAARETDAGSTSGFDASSTTTTGFPVAITASSRAICPPISSRVAVERPSPTSSIRSPTTATTTSAPSAAATASAISASSGAHGCTTGGRGCPSGNSAPRGSASSVRMSAPRACAVAQPSIACRPSSTVVIISRGCPSSHPACPDPPAQSPSWVCASSASGPTTATDNGDVASSGRVPSFSSSTSERRAMSRLSSACAALPTTASSSVPGRRGFSNSPSSNFSVRMRAAAASNASSASSPFETASSAPSKNEGVVMIMSLPARTAAVAAWVMSGWIRCSHTMRPTLSQSVMRVPV
ncbi:hypothetical protein SRABI76_03391 [Microbacterium oxydans]|nr:hypothetical protein SRABI76_03391 [Microbacterium oxydans]